MVMVRSMVCFSFGAVSYVAEVQWYTTTINVPCLLLGCSYTSMCM